MQDGVLNLSRVKLRDQQRLAHGPLKEYSQFGEGIPFGDADSSQQNDRVAKVLARAGVASRREVERLIEEGRVAINGQTLTTPAVKVEPGDIVTVDGEVVGGPEPTRVFRYHKPFQRAAFGSDGLGDHAGGGAEFGDGLFGLELQVDLVENSQSLSDFDGLADFDETFGDLAGDPKAHVGFDPRLDGADEAAGGRLGLVMHLGDEDRS
eukprot:gene34616-biopygen22532